MPSRSTVHRIAYVVAAMLVTASGVLVVAIDRGWAGVSLSGKGDDYLYALVVVSPVLMGLVGGRRWAIVLVGVVFVLTIAVEQLTWTNDPALSGTDDLPPLWAIVVIPLPVMLAGFGVGLRRLLRLARRRPTIGNAAAPDAR